MTPEATPPPGDQDTRTLLALTIIPTAGIKESDTGLAPPSTWDLVADKQVMQQENPLQVARCTKIINADTENAQ